MRFLRSQRTPTRKTREHVRSCPNLHGMGVMGVMGLSTVANLFRVARPFDVAAKAGTIRPASWDGMHRTQHKTPHSYTERQIETEKRRDTDRTSGSRTRGSMDLVSLTVRSHEVGDVKSSRENYLEVERDDVTERNDTIKERRCRLKEKSDDELRTINLAEVAWHDTPGDCWLVIYDYVYDCTEFLKSHPGGQDVLLEYAGRDATLAFIGTGHSTVARATLERYQIGELPPQERIFRIPNGLKVPGF